MSLFKEGDLILLTSGKVGTHNPQNCYVVKVSGISRKDRLLHLTGIISNPNLNEDVTVQNLSSISNKTKSFEREDYLAENVCVHDLSIE